MKFLLGLVLTMLSALPAFAQQPAPPVSLRPGDAVRMDVWRRPDLSGEFVVSAEGRLHHPILQATIVTDVPIDRIAERIGTMLREVEGELQFVIQPLIRVAVGGEVREPNVYLVDPAISIPFVIARAGGPTDRANLSKVVIGRGREAVTIDLNDPDFSPADVRLRSGDQLSIGRRRDILREYIIPLASVTAAIASVIRLTR